MYQRILVPTDGSPLSDRAVGSAIEQAAATGAELVALHVIRPHPESFSEGGSSIPDPEVARADLRAAERGQAIVDQVQEAARAGGVHATGIVTRSARVAESVIDAAGAHKCDLIVMASHGRKGIGRLLLGSETLDVLTHSTLPVLVLR